MSLRWGIFLIVRRSLRQHALSACVTGASIAMGCGLLMSVVSIRAQAYDAMTSSNMGFDGVVGPRGSPLQLILNSLYHLEQSTGKISWKRFRDIADDPRITAAIPLAVGDNYHGFRIVGTEPELFTTHEFQPGQTLAIRQPGRVFGAQAAEAVIGSFVAARTGLRLGDEFNSYHGLTFNPREQHALKFTVVGVLEATNTPADRAIWIPLEGYYRMPGHTLEGAGVKFEPRPGQAIPDEHKEVSAILVKLSSKGLGMGLDYDINRSSRDLTFAWPIDKIMADLFSKLGWMNDVLTLISYLVIVTAAGGVLASVYNTMNERRREFAILRALGARRRTLLASVTAEAAVIAGCGAVAGYLVYGVLVGGTAWVVREKTGIVIDPLYGHAVLALTPVGAALLGGLCGLVPAVKAYRTDVAANLAPQS